MFEAGLLFLNHSSTPLSASELGFPSRSASPPLSASELRSPSQTSTSDLGLSLRRRGAAGPAGRLCGRLGRLGSRRSALTAGGPLLRPAAESVGLRDEQRGGATRVLTRPPAAVVRHHHAVVLLPDGHAHLRVQETVQDRDEDALQTETRGRIQVGLGTSTSLMHHELWRNFKK